MIDAMKILLIMLLSCCFLAQAKKAEKKKEEYVFRPLLIQGKKQMIHKGKDLKVKDGKLVESELFDMTKINFKKRIFE